MSNESFGIYEIVQKFVHILYTCIFNTKTGNAQDLKFKNPRAACKANQRMELLEVIPLMEQVPFQNKFFLI